MEFCPQKREREKCCKINLKARCSNCQILKRREKKVKLECSAKRRWGDVGTDTPWGYRTPPECCGLLKKEDGNGVRVYGVCRSFLQQKTSVGVMVYIL